MKKNQVLILRHTWLIIPALLLFSLYVLFMTFPCEAKEKREEGKASTLSEDEALALSREYSEQGKRSEAIEVLKNALLSNPNSESLLSKLSKEYSLMWLDLMRLREDRTQADRVESIRSELRKGVDFYSRLISMWPKNFSLYFKRAELLEYLENYDSAIRDYTEVIKLLDQEPDSPQKDGYLLYAYFERYVSRNQKMDWHRAATDLEKVIDLAKKWAPTFECGKDEFGPHCFVLPLVREWIPQELERLRQFASLGSEWVYYGYTEKAYLFYNRSRMTTLAEGRVRVWVRSQPKSEAARRWFTERFPSPSGFWHSHILSFFELDCENWTYRLLGLYMYDTRGNIIWSVSLPDSKPTLVPPDEYVWENLFKAVCRDKK